MNNFTKIYIAIPDVVVGGGRYHANFPTGSESVAKANCHHYCKQHCETLMLHLLFRPTNKLRWVYCNCYCQQGKS